MAADNQYVVIWGIDAWAASPVAAALQAWDAVRRHDTTATVFTVITAAGPMDVDVAEFEDLVVTRHRPVAELNPKQLPAALPPGKSSGITCAVCTRVRALDNRQILAAFRIARHLVEDSDPDERAVGGVLLGAVSAELRRRTHNLNTPNEVTGASSS